MCIQDSDVIDLIGNTVTAKTNDLNDLRTPAILKELTGIKKETHKTG